MEAQVAIPPVQRPQSRALRIPQPRDRKSSSLRSQVSPATEAGAPRSSDADRDVHLDPYLITHLLGNPGSAPPLHTRNVELRETHHGDSLQPIRVHSVATFTGIARLDLAPPLMELLSRRVRDARVGGDDGRGLLSRGRATCSWRMCRWTWWTRPSWWGCWTSSRSGSPMTGGAGSFAASVCRRRGLRPRVSARGPGAVHLLARWRRGGSVRSGLTLSWSGPSGRGRGRGGSWWCRSR